MNPIRSGGEYWNKTKEEVGETKWNERIVELKRIMME